MDDATREEINDLVSYLEDNITSLSYKISCLDEDLMSIKQNLQLLCDTMKESGNG